MPALSLLVAHTGPGQISRANGVEPVHRIWSDAGSQTSRKTVDERTPQQEFDLLRKWTRRVEKYFQSRNWGNGEVVLLLLCAASPKASLLGRRAFGTLGAQEQSC